MAKTKVIEVDEEIHSMIKLQAIQAKVSMKQYVKLCVISCKSDVKAKDK